MKYRILRSVFLVVVLAMLCSCVGTEIYTRESWPRADQKRWPDEREVVSVVVTCITGAEYASRRPGALRNYAAFLRLTYSNSSLAGEDVDAGIRALNYVRKIHADAGGSGAFWREVMKNAKQPIEEHEEKRLPGLPPPEDYE